MDTPVGTSTSRSRRTTRRIVTATLAVALTGVMALTAYAAPAQAADRVVRDRGGVDDTVNQNRDFSSGELRALRVRFERQRLVVRFVPGRDTENAGFYTVLVDTDRDGRPERRVDYENNDGRTPFAVAYRARGYSAFPDRSQDVCRRVPRRLEGGNRRPLTVTVRIPLRCLGGPTPAVRVTGFTAEEYGVSDWAPGARSLSAPIRRG